MKTFKEAEKELVSEAIELFCGQEGWKKKAAEALGVATKTFYTLLKKHGFGDLIDGKRGRRKATGAESTETNVSSSLQGTVNGEKNPVQSAAKSSV